MSTVVLPPVMLHASAPLDIWPAFNGASSGGTWSAASYASWIAGIDANFSSEIGAGTVVKTDRGVCSDGSTHVYSYAAGSGGLTVLLTAGVHADERINVFAAMRWFDRFVKSADPSMAFLRSVIRVTYVPFVSPSEYGASRLNSNDVDPNRNFDFYWSQFSSADPQYAKGASAFSEPESALIKTLIDAGNLLHIDCHRLNDDAVAAENFITLGAPSGFSAGKRRMVYAAADAWKAAYGGTWAEWSPNDLGFPTAHSWSSHYNLWQLGNYNAASVLIEANTNLGGSTNNLLTQTGAKYYCGMITAQILAWLSEGQSGPTATPMLWQALRTTADDATAISSGGCLINDSNQNVLTFDSAQPGNRANPTYLQAFYPSPGSIHLEADGYIEGGGTAETRIDISFNVSTSAGGINTFSNANDSFTSITVPASATKRAAFHLSHRIPLTSLSGDNRIRARLAFQRPGSEDSVKIKRARMWATFVPSGLLSPTPAA